ncbi:hypothetical protein HK099_005867 [Clydaea vesicula]|uniref:F-box domain-containing protein n=1 Tax=Clydaea vesicula TaxID=447962 RepID=A0AAD5TYR2_9FUNG|nr:hypothetical protein HK099_005867 [Clydaea vesicula]
MLEELIFFLFDTTRLVAQQSYKNEEMKCILDKAKVLIEKVLQSNKPESNSTQCKLISKRKSLSKTHNSYSAINQFPNEILHIIFSFLKLQRCGSDYNKNKNLLNLTLVNKQWSSVASSLLWTKIYTSDSYESLYLILKGLKLNHDYSKFKKYWFKPDIYSIIFCNGYAPKLLLTLKKSLLKLITLYAENLKELILIPSDIEGRDWYGNIEFDLDDLTEIFKNCPKLDTLKVNTINFDFSNTFITENDIFNDFTEKKNWILKRGFAQLKSLSVIDMRGRKRFSFFRSNPLNSIVNLELYDIIMQFSDSLVQGDLSNLRSLSLLDGEHFNHKTLHNILEKAKNLKVFCFNSGITDDIFDTFVANNINLEEIDCSIFSADVFAEEFSGSWEGLSKFFLSSGSQLKRFKITTYSSFELDDKKLTFLSNALPKLESFGLWTRVESNVYDYEYTPVWRSISLEALRNYLNNVKTLKEVYCLVNDRDDIKKLFKEYNISVIEE